MSDGPEYAHEITSPGRPRPVEVAAGVYAYVTLGNSYDTGLVYVATSTSATYAVVCQLH